MSQSDSLSIRQPFFSICETKAYENITTVALRSARDTEPAVVYNKRKEASIVIATVQRGIWLKDVWDRGYSYKKQPETSSEAWASHLC